MIVDAVVFIQERVVAIDSKFPLENFRRARELEDEGDRRRAKQQFVRDVKRHVDSIAEKYIRPASGTCDFAFMYVPAEAVYADIVADGEEGAIADYATGKRVIPVSPRLLYAYLSTVALGLRGLELQENAREVHQNLADLARLCDRVSGPLDKLGAHLGNAQKQYDEASRAFDRFTNRLETIAERAEVVGDTGEGVALRPLLPILRKARLPGRVGPDRAERVLTVSFDRVVLPGEQRARAIREVLHETDLVSDDRRTRTRATTDAGPSVDIRTRRCSPPRSWRS